MAFDFNICRLVVTESKYSFVISKFLIRFVLFCSCSVFYLLFTHGLKSITGQSLLLISFTRQFIIFESGNIFLHILHHSLLSLLPSCCLIFLWQGQESIFCRIKFEPSPTQVKQDAQRKTVCVRDATGLPKYIKLVLKFLEL